MRDAAIVLAEWFAPTMSWVVVVVTQGNKAIRT